MIDNLNQPEHEIPTIRIRRLRADMAFAYDMAGFHFAFDCDTSGIEQVNLDIDGTVYKVIRDVPRSVAHVTKSR